MNSKKSLNSKTLFADQAFYYIHVTLYHKKTRKKQVSEISKILKNKQVLYFKQVSEISHTLKSKQVLYFKKVLVTSKKILNRKNKKQEKNSFQNLPSMKPIKSNLAKPLIYVCNNHFCDLHVTYYALSDKDKILSKCNERKKRYLT